ncbi:MAG TPA: ROK family protein [Verrucomicrobiales bacterium]|nr:ROK family protein [Verrucomicrobiales bacterium]
MKTGVCCIGIDVGGTKIAAGVLSVPGGRALAKRAVPTQPLRGGQAVLEDVLRLTRALASEAAGLEQSVGAIGLGVCELVDRQGRIASSHCLQWDGLPVCQALSEIAPALVEADVRAAGLAEALFGAGKPYGAFLYITAGTGISCCLMVEGRPFFGAEGMTGVMASSPIPLRCERCHHVNTRTLEDIASGPALAARFEALRGQAGSGRRVLAAAIGGDAVAGRIVQEAGEALGSQTGLLVNVLDPEAVILGGGLGSSVGPYWDHFAAATRRSIWSCKSRGLPVLQAATGADAGWMGAAAQAWRQLLES